MKNAKIITDREPSIITAIENSLPNYYHFYCWNHIKQDVKNWIKNKKNSEKTDCNIYVAHISDLLDSDSEMDFQYKYNLMSPQWSKAAKQYLLR